MDPVFAYKVYTERRKLNELIREKGNIYDAEIQSKSKELDELILRFIKDRKFDKRENESN